MASQSGARTRAVITYYRLKYADAEERLEAIRADYLAAFESAEAQGGKTATSQSADGFSATWTHGLSQDQRLDAMREALTYFEGGMKQRNVAQGRIL
jgi:hypothetical protein